MALHRDGAAFPIQLLVRKVEGQAGGSQGATFAGTIKEVGAGFL